MQITTHKIVDGVLVVYFWPSELDGRINSDGLGKMLCDLAAEAAGRKMLLNLRGVRFVSSEIVGQFFRLRKTCNAKDVRLILCGLERYVSKVFSLLRLTDFVEVCADEASAHLAFEYGSDRPSSESMHIDFSACQTAAESGDSAAQFELARCYDEGQLVQQDFERAFDWCAMAAEQGHASAQYELGKSYAFGLQVERDYDHALQWYRRAAEQGHADAQYALAVSIEFGLSGTDQDNQDVTEARRWYQCAAEQGHKAAQEALGELCGKESA